MSQSVVIYHNPRCSKSRAALALLRDAGCEPQIVRYLDTPPSAAQLSAWIKAMGVSARDVLRTKEAVYKELGLGDETITEDELVAHMVANPILIERPIVVAGGAARLGRPPERVLELLGDD